SVKRGDVYAIGARNIAQGPGERVRLDHEQRHRRSPCPWIKRKPRIRERTTVHLQRRPRAQTYSDPDASWGHRSAVSTRKGGGFYGYRIHAAVCAATGPP